MFCNHCGKEIDPNAVICPFCGVATGKPIENKTNGLAIAGFVLAFFFPLVGLILSIIARKQCLENREGGENLALAGIIISAVSMAIVVISIIVVFAIFLPAVGTLINSYYYY